MSAVRKSDYPGKVAIRHAVEAARLSGLDVAGFELMPGGVIRIIDRKSLPQPAAQPEDEWAKWDAEGRLG